MPRQKRPVQDIDLEYAAHPPKPGAGAGDTIRAQHFLHRTYERVPSVPEPVTVPRMVNGRPLRGWERAMYREAMARERRAELELFRGLIS